MVEFKEWPKIPRGQNGEITITEKIDGTNACVIIHANEVIGAQSRNQMLCTNVGFGWEVNAENYGFGLWVRNNANELSKLGDGYHYGEWAGPGIQKNPHNLDRKRFFLFNTARWNKNNPNLPECCDVVPILYEGLLDPFIIEETLNGTLFGRTLEKDYEAEGIVVYYHKTRRYEKYTFKNQNGKWDNERTD